MKVVMVMHECGVPQWLWDGAAGEGILEALLGVLEDIAEAVDEELEEARGVPPCSDCIALAEAFYALDKVVGAYNSTTLPSSDNLKGETAWMWFCSRVLQPEYISQIQTRYSIESVRDTLEYHDELFQYTQSFLAREAGIRAELGEKAKLLELLVQMVVVVVEAMKDASRQYQLRMCLPQLGSTQSFLTNQGLQHASLIAFGKMHVAMERATWKSVVRAGPNTTVQEDNNLFLGVASDEGESGQLLQRLSTVLKDACIFAAGSYPRLCSLANDYWSQPQPAIAAVVRAILKLSAPTSDSPCMAVQGVQCLHEFTPLAPQDRNAQSALQCSAVQQNLLENIDGALAACRRIDGSADKILHCLIFVNGKLAACHTRRGGQPLTAHDLFLLDAYVEGCFTTKDGKSYDPGQGAAWDPLASTSDVLANGLAKAPTEEQVALAEAILHPLGVDRTNFISQESLVRAESEARWREGMMDSVRKIQVAWNILRAHRRHALRNAASNSTTDGESQGGRRTADNRRSHTSSSTFNPVLPPKPQRQQKGLSESPPTGAAGEGGNDNEALWGFNGFPALAAQILSHNSRKVTSNYLPGSPPSDVNGEANRLSQSSASSFLSRQQSNGFRSPPLSPPLSPELDFADNPFIPPIPEPPPSLPFTRIVWLQQGTSGEVRPCLVYVDSLGTPQVPSEVELKFSSIRVCLVEELAGGVKGHARPDEGYKARLEAARNELRRRLSPIRDFLTTTEKTHFYVGDPFLEQCPGLIHFILVDRTSHNRVVSPRILPMRPLGDDGFMHFTASQQQVTEAGLLPKVWDMVNGAHVLLMQGYSESLWGGTAFQYHHRVWVEDDDTEVPVTPQLLHVIATRPWTTRDFLEQMMPKEIARRSVRCYELYAMYIGTLPPEAIEGNSRRLVNLLLPHRRG